MILPDFILNSRKNQTWAESGIDSKKRCLNRSYFKNFPYPINYKFNSRGFRDAEWPATLDELQNAIWCFGDSFTTGIGSPIEHTWVNILQTKLNRRCINVSLDGASNFWIARKAVQVLKTISPTTMCIQWSFLHRVESENQSKSDEQRRRAEVMSDIDQHQNFFKCMELLECNKNNTKIFYSTIPHSGLFSYTKANNLWDSLKGTDWPDVSICSNYDNIPNNILSELKTFGVDEYFKNYQSCQDYKHYIDMVKHIDQVDYARDYFHYDKLTAEKFVNDLIELFEQ